MASSIQGSDDGQGLHVGVPVRLFWASFAVALTASFSYDVAADGSRFLVNVQSEQQSPPLQMILDPAPGG
jgi:hypothetical protein